MVVNQQQNQLRANCIEKPTVAHFIKKALHFIYVPFSLTIHRVGLI